ncbi:MAG TPA: PLD nuclease N-terminal domain-containing protein [Methanomassiliicoccales archaeon]|nr:PLD nuclease N-terminal domain-containing protein [Methanomassiliicoccales archaeon]
MDIWLVIVAIAWFGLGAIIAAFIYLDMKGRKSIKNIWIVVGFLLNVIGLLLYYLSVRVSRRHPYQYPPSPRYGNPDYDFDLKRGMEEAPVEKKSEETPKKEFTEGIPRCPHCGAAISAHEWECPRCNANLRS